ncbi:hypothetical protein RCIP0075_00055 [Klebsiella phage RCIP0075]
MTAMKKAAKKTARRAAKPQQETTAALDTLMKPKEVRITESQLFGTTPSAVFLDEAAGVEIGGKPSEAELTPQQAAVLDAACELIQADLPKAHRSLADWIAEEATQGRFYGSLKAAEVGYALILGRRPGGAS